MDESERVTAEALVARAVRARSQAYAPYSGFSVGAAVLTSEGSVFTGCNVENASYGLTCCAERVAVFSAVAAGCKEFQAIAVASDGGAAPCGACRQVMREFNRDLVIHLAAADGRFKTRRLADLLPESFGPEDLKGGA